MFAIKILCLYLYTYSEKFRVVGSKSLWNVKIYMCWSHTIFCLIYHSEFGSKSSIYPPSLYGFTLTPSVFSEYNCIMYKFLFIVDEFCQTKCDQKWPIVIIYYFFFLTDTLITMFALMRWNSLYLWILI